MNNLNLVGTPDQIDVVPAGNGILRIQISPSFAAGGAVPSSRSISTTAPLTGGGDLSADRTLSISDFIASGASHARGAVPDPGASAGTTKFLREDATWDVPAGSGAFSIYPTMTVPVSSNFAWQNQGSASALDRSDRMVMVIPDSNPTVEARLFEDSSTLSTPYTIKLAICAPAILTSTNGALLGISLRNSGSGTPNAFLAWATMLAATGSIFFRQSKEIWTSTTLFASRTAGAVQNNLIPMPLLFLAITDDGATREYWMSHNGKDYIGPIISESNATTISGANKAGLYLYNLNGSAISVPVSVYHWSITSGVFTNYA